MVASRRRCQRGPSWEAGLQVRWSSARRRSVLRGGGGSPVMAAQVAANQSHTDAARGQVMRTWVSVAS